jgi:hypothetical protein
VNKTDRVSKTRKMLLDRIREDSAEMGVAVNWEHLNTAPIPALKFCSIMLQLHKPATK